MAEDEVTREHRLWAIALQEEWEYGMLTPDHKAWLDGLPTVGEYSSEESAARAIAAAELRGKVAAVAEFRTLLDVHHALTGHDSLLCYVRAHLDLQEKYQPKEPA